MKRPRFSLSFLAGLGLLVLTGCNVIPPPTPDPTRYFVLTAPAVPAPATDTVRSSCRIGLRAIELAPYLRKGVLVVRQGDNEVVFDDFARWGEPLDAGIARVLRERLLAEPHITRVLTAPFPLEENRDYDVSVVVRQCEGVRSREGAGVRLVAEIEIARVSNDTVPEVVVRGMFTLPETAWNGKNYAALARALSEAVAALGTEIVAVLPAKK